MPKKLQEDLLIPQNCDGIRVPILNDDVIKNKNIHYYYKRNDKRLADLQGTIVSATAEILQLAHTCLEADRANTVINSKTVVAKAVDALTLLRTTKRTT